MNVATMLRSRRGIRNTMAMEVPRPTTPAMASAMIDVSSVPTIMASPP